MISNYRYDSLCRNISGCLMGFEIFGNQNKSVDFRVSPCRPTYSRKGGIRFGPRVWSVAYNIRKRMPRFKLKGALERSAAEDLWKHTLSRIPTLFGRLAYMASLRDPNSGIYRHHGLSAVFGRDEGAKAMRESHERTFLDWLSLTLEEKYYDLGNYLAELEDPAQKVVEHWLSARVYRTYVPGSAREMERELFCRDLEALLETIKNAPATAGRGSWPLA